VPIAINDTAADIETLSAAEISSLPSQNVVSITATDASVTFSLPDAEALVDDNLAVSVPSGDHVYLDLTSADSFDPSTLSSLATAGIDSVKVEAGGSLDLEQFSSLSGDLDNAGFLTIGTSSYYGAGFSVGGTFTNSGSTSIGIDYFENYSFSPGLQLTVGSFDNTSTGVVTATYAMIVVSGNLQNDGNLSLYSATYGLYGYDGSFSFGSSLNVGGALSNSVTGVLSLQGSTATIRGDLDNDGQINLSATYGSSTVYNGTGQTTTTTTVVEAELTVSGTLDNDGVIEAASGPSLITGVISGTGSLRIEQGASLELASAVSGDAVQFAQGGTLVIDDLASASNGVQQQDFNAAISGFAPGDAIDISTAGLGNFSAITAVDQGRYDATTGTTVLTLLDGQSAVGTLALSGDYDLESFNLTAGTGLVALQDAGVTTDVAGFEANQAQLDAIPGGFSIIDTAANVAADFPAIAADVHVSAITLTDTAPVLSLTAAELENDGTTLAKITNSAVPIAISDTAADIETLSAAEISSLPSQNVVSITATDASVTFSLPDAEALVDDNLAVSVPSGDHVYLDLTSADSFDPSTLYSLATAGIDSVKVEAGGSLDLEQWNSLSGDLDNAGFLTIGTSSISGAGFSVGGTFTNSGSTSIGIDYFEDYSLLPVPQLTVDSFDNTSTGVVTATYAMILVSDNLQNDSNFSLYSATYQQGGYSGENYDFASVGSNLYVGGTLSNSVTGVLSLGASTATISGNLDNDGQISLAAADDYESFYYGSGFVSFGSSLNVGGALSNSVTGVMSLVASTATISGDLDNDGQINLSATYSSSTVYNGIGQTTTATTAVEAELTVRGTLDNNGVLSLQGSTATISGDLDNEGQINLSAAYDSSSFSSYGTGQTTTTTTTTPVEAELTVNGALDNNGVIEAASGPSLITGVISGTGSLQIEQGASLELSSAVSGDAVQFAPGGGTLVIDDLASASNGVQQQDFNAAISGFAPDDTIDMSTSGLGNFNAITAVDQGRYDASTGTTILTLLDGQSAVGTLTLSGDYGAASFSLGSNPSNSDIVLTTSFGQAIDGYIEGATVFADANNNGKLDPGEVSAITDSTGQFSLVGGTGPLVLTGGTDTSTHLPFTGIMTAPAGYTVITPLTTLVNAQLPVNPTAHQVQVAEQAVLTTFGITLAPGESLSTLDPIAGTVAGDPGAKAAFVAGTEVADTIQMLASALSGQSGSSGADAYNAVTLALAAEIMSNSGAAVSLTSAGTIGKILTAADPNIDQRAATQIEQIVTGSNGNLVALEQGASGPTQFLKIGGEVNLVAQGETSTALQNNSSLGQAVTDYTGSNLTDAVNTAAGQVDVICFFPGTPICTPAGDIPVEMLRRGDLVLTTDGRTVPVTWLGRQTVSTRFADPLRVLPIRIMQGALGDNVPSRDLLLSPCHAILIGEALFQASALVNGTSIRRETNVPEIFTYYHVELDDHSLILAENTPAETFIDNVDRLAFDNWAEHEALYPGGKPIVEMPYPRAKSRRQVPRSVRTMLDRRVPMTDTQLTENAA